MGRDDDKTKVRPGLYKYPRIMLRPIEDLSLPLQAFFKKQI